MFEKKGIKEGKKRVGETSVIEMKFFDKPLPIFRGDSRHPIKDGIFEFGMQRRASTWAYYNTHNQKQLEPTLRFFKNDEEKIDDVDLIPASGISTTIKFDFAPMFPLPLSDEKKPSDHTWIYLVKVQQGFLMHNLQAKYHSDLTFCQEVSTRDIPSGDVICAIQCKRFWNVNEDAEFKWQRGMHYVLTSDIIWNPKLSNVANSESLTKLKKGIVSFVESKKGQYIEIPIPKNQADLILAQISEKPPAKCKILTEEEHQIYLSLVKFVQLAKQATLTNENNLTDQIIKEALQCLNPNNVNQFIPGTDLTPLMYAVKNNLIGLSTELIKQGANPAKRNDEGMNALDYATNESVKNRLIQIINDNKTFSKSATLSPR